MKRILLLFSALMLSCIALWAHDVEIDGIYYNLDETNKTARVTYRGNYHDDYDDEYRGSVTIPETITYYSQTYSVKYIVDFAAAKKELPLFGEYICSELELRLIFNEHELP